jgi:hypothetical protein
MRSSMVASRLGISRSIAEAMDGNPNSIVAEIREAIARGVGGSGMKGGLSPASAVTVTATEQNAAK